MKGLIPGNVRLIPAVALALLVLKRERGGCSPQTSRSQWVDKAEGPAQAHEGEGLRHLLGR